MAHTGKPLVEGASREDNDRQLSSIAGDKRGRGSEPGVGQLEAGRGDPRCPSDWAVYDCFWCAASNCVNPRWHVFSCRSCHGANTF
jgi:hypothetical protein